jgi:acetyl esterase
MATTQPDAMHDDFKKIPGFTLRFNFLFVGLINAFMAFDRYRNGGPSNPHVARHEEQITNADGSTFKVIVMSPVERQGPIPALIYYHGGAFALSYASMHLKFCERYAHEANCHVIVVDYRLALSKPFPHGFDDCYRAFEWVRERAETIGIDTDRIAVGGDSAGGTFAAGVSQKALDAGLPLCAQLLIYPALDSDCKSESARGFERTPIWNAGSNRNMWDMYLRDVDRHRPPGYAAPGHREDLARLAPAYVETAEFDPLRDEGREYAQRLKDAGVEVETNPTSGTIHGYEMAADNPETIRSLAERISFLQKQFGTQPKV